MQHSYQAIIKNGKTKQQNTASSESTQKSSTKKRKLGFMQGEMILPDNINWADKQVQDLFASN